MIEPDKRLHAFQADIETAMRMEIVTPVASMRREPASSSMQTTQALFGERINVFEVRNGWLWCQLERDGYVGYIAGSSAVRKLSTPTHHVAIPSTFLYPQPDIKSQPIVILTLNARLEVVSSDEKFARLSNGNFVYVSHLKPLNDFESDFVEVAEKFLHVPYHWGGKTVHGVDCSGLVQTSLEVCGVQALRDADMQERQLGQNLMINDLDGLRRGDLVFWKGHVGIMTDDRMLLHANGYHMMAVKEPLAVAVERIAQTGLQVTSIKRF
jgi:cell wall-associated NlpC family hydrolase